MSVLRSRVRLLAVLALATFAGGAWVADLHGGHAVGADEPWESHAYTAAPHDAPDRSLHVEAAVEAEHPDCGACLLRSLSKGTEAHPGSDRVAVTDTRSDGGDTVGSLRAGIDQLPGSRGPPRA